LPDEQAVRENSAATFSLKQNDDFQRHGRMTVNASHTEIIAVSAKDSYRQLARTLPTAADEVLEIGAASGDATQALAETGARVVAVDKAATCRSRLQTRFTDQDNVVAACVDGRNVPRLAELAPSPTLIYIDIGGDAHLDAVALQLRLCLRAFEPRVVVVRSFELATLASLIGQVEPPHLSGLRPEERPLGRDLLTNLLDLSGCTSTETRCFAARRLGQLADESARARLADMEHDPHPKVRQAAARALAITAAPPSSHTETQDGC
jgi:hypothetical protein